MKKPRRCPECRCRMEYHRGTRETFPGWLCPECEDFHIDREADDYRTAGDNGPTGHGDICWSDADPGL